MIEDTSGATPNPWLSMWSSPRATIRRIVQQENPESQALFLAVLAGIGATLNRSAFKGGTDDISIPVILAVSVIGGALGGILSLYIWSGLLHWTGRSIGGRATPEEVRAAVAWGKVPAAWGLAVWPFALLLFGRELFANSVPRLDTSPFLYAAFLGFVLTQITLGIWSFVTFLEALAEVQGFSAWKALGNAALAGMAVLVPLLLLVVLIWLPSAL